MALTAGFKKLLLVVGLVAIGGGGGYYTWLKTKDAPAPQAQLETPIQPAQPQPSTQPQVTSPPVELPPPATKSSNSALDKLNNLGKL